MAQLSPANAHFSGPIPGESLTRAPGSVPWERPPQYTKVDEVMHYFIQQFQNKDIVHNLLAVIEQGAPLDTVIHTILMHGFTEGKWTPALAIMLVHPLEALFRNMLKRAGIKYINSYTAHKGQNDSVFQAAIDKKDQDAVNTQRAKDFMQQQNVPSMKTMGKGLMSIKGNQ